MTNNVQLWRWPDRRSRLHGNFSCARAPAAVHFHVAVVFSPNTHPLSLAAMKWLSISTTSSSASDARRDATAPSPEGALTNDTRGASVAPKSASPMSEALKCRG
jgi:hypothetical protein